MNDKTKQAFDNLANAAKEWSAAIEACAAALEEETDGKLTVTHSTGTTAYLYEDLDYREEHVLTRFANVISLASGKPTLKCRYADGDINLEVTVGGVPMAMVMDGPVDDRTLEYIMQNSTICPFFNDDYRPTSAQEDADEPA